MGDMDKNDIGSRDPQIVRKTVVSWVLLANMGSYKSTFQFSVWPPWRKQLPCDGWGKPMVLQVHREHIIRSIGTYQIHWFTTCLHRIIQDRFSTGLPLGVVLCWFPSIYLLIQVCVASMFLPFHIGIGSCIELLVRIHGGTSKCSDCMFQQLPKTGVFYVCFSSCHIIETYPIWYVMISCRLDIISFRNPDIASHTMCLWAERFFLWEANRGDSNNCTLRVSQFQPVGNWF